MREIKVWPHLTIIAILCAALGGAAAMLWNKHKLTAEAQALTLPARVERVDGQVGLDRGLDNDATNAQWIAVTPNTPLSVGDRVYVRDGSRASLAFTGRNFARLNPNTALDVLSLTPRRTQVALRDGSAIFDVGALAPDELFEVATPLSAIDLQQPGLYEVGINDRGNTIVSVLSGLAQVVGLAGSGQVSKGEVLTLVGQTAADVALARLAPQTAGGLLNDYYGYRYPNIYDGRYSNYDAYLSDPYYYDPYNRDVSYRYAPALIPGLDDLDYYGDWQDVSNYGYCWHPRVASGWAPYQQGYWTLDDPYGLTWVSDEPWGYAPYHYGRWAYVNDGWYWVPDSVNTVPTYAPALVAFVPLTQADQIGWVPLAPGDPYVPRYYNADWQPQYLARPQVVEQVVNLNAPGALTVVTTQDFGRVINRDVITRVDPRAFAQTRPVLDPLAVTALRQAALTNAIAHRGFVLPPGIARRLDDTRVVASTAPLALPFRKDRDLARALRVESVPEQQRKQKLQFRDERQTASAPLPNEARPPAAGQVNTSGAEQARAQQMNALAAQAARGDRAARRQWQQLEREQRQAQRAAARQQVTSPNVGGAPQAEAERARAAAAMRAQGERVGQQMHVQRQAERQQAQAQAQQQRAAARAQFETQRRQVEAQRQAQRQIVIRERPQPARVRAPEQTPQPNAPRPAVNMPPGQMRQQQHQPPPQRMERPQGPPPAARPQTDTRPPGGNDKGGGKGKGRHP